MATVVLGSVTAASGLEPRLTCRAYAPNPVFPVVAPFARIRYDCPGSTPVRVTPTVSPYAYEDCWPSRAPAALYTARLGDSTLSPLDCIFTTSVPLVAAGTVTRYQ